MKALCILGSTGSIGVSTLDVVARHPDRFSVFALTAASNLERMQQQCRQFTPAFAVMTDPARARDLRARLAEDGLPTEVLSGPQALLEVAAHPQVVAVMAAIVGAAGLPPTLAAAEAGKQVLLANKEALVMSGQLFMQAAARAGATLLPIDSEHNAIFQALPAGYDRQPAAHGVRRILLTASGGPFRSRDPVSLSEVTPEEACAHPNWVMGRKISVDSASMMNKGLEVIEAHWLFGVGAEQIEVLIHPQSIIHSMVEYADGSVLAQMGNPDMRTPIAHALAYPERIEAGVRPLDLLQVARLTFEQPDERRFPCLRLAYQALRAGGTAPAILNAANEVAVAAFLDRRIGYLQIPELIEQALSKVPCTVAGQLDAVIAADHAARQAVRDGLPG